MYPSQLLKGTFETIVLKLLSENESMYGYAIIQKVKGLSEGEISLPAGSLYPILHKLEEQGLAASEKIRSGKRTQLHYSITPAGSEQAKARVEEFMRFARTMITLLKPQITGNT